MPSPNRPIGVLLLFAGLLASPHPAHAAQSYDNCAGTISSLPATISTQGVWCLKKDLSTAITNGYAITIAANNVTIDCNDFKLGGLAAGSNSYAAGIYADSRQNTSIRHCNIRGFFYGIELGGTGAGNLVEDNRLDNNLYEGIFVLGDNNVIRRNIVNDTGGSPGNALTWAIYASADVLDNKISGAFGTATNSWAYGIALNTTGNVASGNIVENLTPSGTGYTCGIVAANGPHMVVRDNILIQTNGAAGYGICSNDTANAVCTGNTSTGFPSGISSYCVGTGNTVQ